MFGEIIIAVALKSESNGLLEKVITGRNNVHIVYTNVGKINAAYFLTKKINELKAQNKEIKAIINLGTAGGVGLPRGSLVICNQFIQRDFDHKPLGFKEGVNHSYCENHNLKESEYCSLMLEHKKFIHNKELDLLPNVPCGTGDNFETMNHNHSKEISELSKSAEDMEAYALALIAKYEDINFMAIKYISDEITPVKKKKHKQNEQFEGALTEGASKLSNILNIILSSIE